MYSTSDMSPEPEENFIEAAELIDSHRTPVSWLLIIQIAVLGTFSVWLTGLSAAAQIAMLAMLVGFLWYGNSFWLLPFCAVVFGGQMIRSNGRYFAFSSGLHLAECILLLLTLIASFRYIELRRYGQAFGLAKSYRGLHSSKNKILSSMSLVVKKFFRRQWYHTVIALMVAFALLKRFPASTYWRDEFWMLPVAARFILLSLLLFFLWFVCRAVFSMWDWFLLTPRQADVAIRSWANREFWKEMAGVERRRERLRIDEEV